MWGDSISTVEGSISTVEAVQYSGGIASVLWGIASVHVEDSISTLIFLYLANIANQKLSAIYNFETKIVLDFYCN